MIAAALTIVLAAFIVITAFVFVSTVERVTKTEAWCPWYVWCIAFLWLILGVFADMVFNWLWGTVIFRELPREKMFTHRVRRHLSSAGWRQDKALQWADFLNAVDPGHV